MWVTATNVPCGSHGFEVRSYLSTNTRYDCKRKKKIFLANIICYSGSKMSSLWFKPIPCYFYKYFGNFGERKTTIFEKNCIFFKTWVGPITVLKYIFLIIRFQLSNLLLVLALIRDLIVILLELILSQLSNFRPKGAIEELKTLLKDNKTYDIP